MNIGKVSGRADKDLEFQQIPASGTFVNQKSKPQSRTSDFESINIDNLSKNRGLDSREVIRSGRELFNEKLVKTVCDGSAQAGLGKQSQLEQKGYGPNLLRDLIFLSESSESESNDLEPSKELQDLASGFGSKGVGGGKILTPRIPFQKNSIKDFYTEHYTNQLWLRLEILDNYFRELKGKISPNMYYEVIASQLCYFSCGLDVKGLAAAQGYAHPAQLLFKNNLQDKKIIEVGCGDADILIELKKARDHYNRTKPIRNLIIPQGRLSKRDILNAVSEMDKSPVSDTFDDYLLGIDFSESFTNNLRSQYKIPAIKADFCSPKLFSQNPQLKKRSADMIIMKLFFDRASDIRTALKNARLLAKKDRSTRFHISLIHPFSNIGDSMDKNGKSSTAIKFWDKENDIREKWTESTDLYKLMEQAIWTLSKEGFITDNICEYEHTVLSPHGGIQINDFKNVSDVPHFDLFTDEIRERFERAKSGEYPKDKKLFLPQVYYAGSLNGFIQV